MYGVKMVIYEVSEVVAMVLGLLQQYSNKVNT